MGARQLGCLGSIVVSLVVGAAAAAAIPTLEWARDPTGVTWFARVFAFVMVSFVVGAVLNKLLATLVPTPAELAKREADRAMKDAALQTTAEASAGRYLRVRGRLEVVDGATLDAPVTARACLASVVTRHSEGTKRRGIHRRQRGVRARLVDSAGSVLVALDGQDVTMTGDATADAIMQRGLDTMRAFGEDPRLFPEITFAGSPVHAGSDGTSVENWPEGAAAPSAERVGTIDARDFPQLAGHRASYDEEVLLAGQEVEVVGLVVASDAGLVLTGPVNGKLRVVAR